MQQGEAGRQQSWQIKVYVRANKSRFKFEAKNLKFSIFLKLQKFLLQVKSETQDSLPRKGPRSLISKVKNFCKRSSNPNPPPAKKQTVPAAAKKKSQNLKNPERGSVVNRLVQSASEKPLCTGSLLGCSLGYLSGSLWAKEMKAFMNMILGLCSLLCIALLLRKCIPGKARALLMFGAIATVSCVTVFCLDKDTSFDVGDLCSELARKAWNYTAGSGWLYELSQVMISRLSQSAGLGAAG